ncbi:MAG: hypothetical protein K6C12_01930 [Oscillospiraceae bacterium]|nr:hypothetical protein [Oscillospiraceae bacterium]
MFRSKYGELCLTVYGLLVLMAILMLKTGYTDVLPRNGWYEADGKWVYFVDGDLVRSQVKAIDGIWYGFQENGELLDHDQDAFLMGPGGSTGWYRAMEGGELYRGEWVTIFQANGLKQRYYYGEDGRAANGAVPIGQELYLFGERGNLLCNAEILINGERWISDEYGFLKKSTVPAAGTGDETEEEKDTEDEEGDGTELTGGQQPEGKETGEGKEQTPGLQDPNPEKEKEQPPQNQNPEQDKTQNKDGENQTPSGGQGQQKEEESGGGQNPGPEQKPQPKSGWTQLEDGTFVYCVDGVILRSTLIEVEGKTYCLLESGRPLCGESILFPLPDGSGYRSVRARADGSLYRNEFYLDPGTQEEYYYGADCFAATGVCTLPNGTRCLFDQTGKKLRGLQFIYNALHLCTSDGSYIGVIQREGWNVIDGERYYLFNGQMMTEGRHTIDWQYCYFNENGMLLHDCVHGDELLDSDGHIVQEGWAERPEGRYYVDPETHRILRASEASIENKSYYFDENGLMATGEVTVNGELRRYGSDGVLIPPDESTSGDPTHTDPEGTDTESGSDPDENYQPENEEDPAAKDQSPVYTPGAGPTGRTGVGASPDPSGSTGTQGKAVTAGADRRVTETSESASAKEKDSDPEKADGSSSSVLSRRWTVGRRSGSIYIRQGSGWRRMPGTYLHLTVYPNGSVELQDPWNNPVPGGSCDVYIRNP